MEHFEGKVPTETRMEQFYVEVNKFTMASHMMWGIWSIVQAQNSQLAFDFNNYALIRLGQYFQNKDRLFGL